MPAGNILSRSEEIAGNTEYFDSHSRNGRSNVSLVPGLRLILCEGVSAPVADEMAAGAEPGLILGSDSFRWSKRTEESHPAASETTVRTTNAQFLSF
jgi:hypothetical protein